MVRSGASRRKYEILNNPIIIVRVNIGNNVILLYLPVCSDNADIIKRTNMNNRGKHTYVQDSRQYYFSDYNLEVR